MASKLLQLKVKAAQASQFVAKHGAAYYNQLLEQNKEYIVQPPTIETCHELSKKLLYTRMASLWSAEQHLLPLSRSLQPAFQLHFFHKIGLQLFGSTQIFPATVYCPSSQPQTFKNSSYSAIVAAVPGTSTTGLQQLFSRNRNP
ncbi:hypothetical protein IEQ34_015882 [Dendrobium chrysotoxum]|uniref:Uncharacterized protein n=1 Tax=Dendrobium chrysotoxum TaxID=161865 RepID=A0AAV7G192_DENCH|nr:hypothetical protein IEQ34_015882 [Dendrobium chrysotoxum]